MRRTFQHQPVPEPVHIILWDTKNEEPLRFDTKSIYTARLPHQYQNNVNDTHNGWSWSTVIRTLGTRDRFRDTQDLIDCMQTYRPSLPPCNALRRVVELDLEYNLSVLLPKMAQLALQLPKLLPHSVPLLSAGKNLAVTLSQRQIACLLANAFFCTLPETFMSYPDTNFDSLFQDQDEKLKCLFNYFRRVTLTPPERLVTFERRSLQPDSFPTWHTMDQVLFDIGLDVREQGLIEDAEGMLQLDFANRFLGGGVLRRGCVQEEIRFLICPELIVTRILTQVLNDGDCVFVKGAEQFSNYVGYASTFRFTGDFIDMTPVDSMGRRKTEILAIDALRFHNRSSLRNQLEIDTLDRELNKLYCGFVPSSITSFDTCGISTGNWGCGAFNGDVQLKFLMQLMVAASCPLTPAERSAADQAHTVRGHGRRVAYYTFGDSRFGMQLQSGQHPLVTIGHLLKSRRVSVGKLYKWLESFHAVLGDEASRRAYRDLFHFVYDQCMHIKDC